MVSETTISVTLTADLADRLAALARDDGRSIESCLQEAVTDYVTSREDFAEAVAALDEPQPERPFLRVVGE